MKRSKTGGDDRYCLDCWVEWMKVQRFSHRKWVRDSSWVDCRLTHCTYLPLTESGGDSVWKAFRLPISLSLGTNFHVRPWLFGLTTRFLWHFHHVFYNNYKHLLRLALEDRIPNSRQEHRRESREKGILFAQCPPRSTCTTATKQRYVSEQRRQGDRVWRSSLASIIGLY